MTKVRTDLYGLYVRVGGYLFRPQVCRHKRNECKNTMSFLILGQEVKARHLGGSVLGIVNNETWFSHGEYTGKKSYECWNP